MINGNKTRALTTSSEASAALTELYHVSIYWVFSWLQNSDKLDGIIKRIGTQASRSNK